MNDERQFPLRFPRSVPPSTLPKMVPWGLVAQFEDRALRNHFQTLERLAQRGGLSPVELWALLHCVPVDDARWLDPARVDADIKQRIAAYEAREPAAVLQLHALICARCKLPIRKGVDYYYKVGTPQGTEVPVHDSCLDDADKKEPA